jgi:Mn-dependent DtxR family transcriptional regulator
MVNGNAIETDMKAISDYLAEKGWMSKRDIATDLKLEPVEVDIAIQRLQEEGRRVSLGMRRESYGRTVVWLR